MQHCTNCERNNIAGTAARCPRCASTTHLAALATTIEVVSGVTIEWEELTLNGQTVTESVSRTDNGIYQFGQSSTRKWNEIRAPFTAATHPVNASGVGATANTLNADGSVVTVDNMTDGEVVTTTQRADGIVVRSTRMTDGTVVTTTPKADGSVVKTVATTAGTVVTTTETTIVPKAWTFKRQVCARFGITTVLNTAARASAPPPLCSGKTTLGDDIEELSEFNNGHVLALQLGGPDAVKNIVPMVRWFNQSGKWRTLELRLAALVRQLRHAAILNGTATLVTTPLTVTIEIEYRRAGDPRVPSGFYVRAERGGTNLEHYILANKAGTPPALPLPLEKAFVMAHWALGLFPFDDATRRQNFLDHHAAGQGLDATTIAQAAVWQVIVGIAVQPVWLPAALNWQTPLPNPPCAALHWLDNENVQANSLRQVAPYAVIPLEQSLPQQDYSTSQREIIRLYNRWRNGGNLVSDARPNLYAGEKCDLYLNLSESGGRSFPEVDHILPKSKNGPNSYANARLVSFAHNHIYRDKATFGSLSLSYQNYRNSGWPATLKALRDSEIPTRVTSASPYYVVTNILKARKDYLRAEQRILGNYAGEETANPGYTLIAGHHATGVADFENVAMSANARAALVTAFGNVALTNL